MPTIATVPPGRARITDHSDARFRSTLPTLEPLQQVLDMLPEMVAVFDLGGRLVHANRLLVENSDARELVESLGRLLSSAEAPVPRQRGEFTLRHGDHQVRGRPVDLSEFG